MEAVKRRREKGWRQGSGGKGREGESEKGRRREGRREEGVEWNKLGWTAIARGAEAEEERYKLKERVIHLRGGMGDEGRRDGR